ncbi:hypothetical protein J2X31_002241 [Flavobacterium arsenatis]|uniref:Secretion system C-terminal sorting domain-containing protein n=1 Tax=Flavobacterium arsenatis TaxID=1484332 RepID=A0ABU1TQI1_9FLAO|nr:T9SS type A sorting domain-containing protein [Flavobacterium arsenatis]MDR6968224.1 hypothetical protein [Flavobacterium arsenatis]
MYILNPLTSAPGFYTLKVNRTFGAEVNLHKIEVYNILGAKISMIQNSKTIDLSNFESGVYLIKLFSDETTIIKKIIKQ